MFFWHSEFNFPCLLVSVHVCGHASYTSECMFRCLLGLMRAFSIWGCVGGRSELCVSPCVTCSHKSVLTWCVFEVKQWNSDEWVCVVSCGKSVDFPLQTGVAQKPLWRLLDAGHCKGKERALKVHVTVSLVSCVGLHGIRDAIIRTPLHSNTTLCVQCWVKISLYNMSFKITSTQWE